MLSVIAMYNAENFPYRKHLNCGVCERVNRISEHGVNELFTIPFFYESSIFFVILLLFSALLVYKEIITKKIF